MPLRSGRLHVSEQRAHLHRVHTTALSNARPPVASSAPSPLQTRGRLVDGKAILDAHARATVVDEENARLGAKLQSIYCRARAQGHRPLAQREAHLVDPEMDRRRKHTQMCMDQRRAASAERTVQENKYIAARLAATHASTGSLQAARRYDEVLAERSLLRSRFKSDGDYQLYLAGREKRQERLLARRAARLALKEAERAGGEWGALQRQLQAHAEGRMALLPPSPAQQRQQLLLRSASAQSSIGSIGSGGSAYASSRHPFASSASRSILAAFEDQLCQGPSSRADQSEYDEEEDELAEEEEERYEVERAEADAEAEAEAQAARSGRDRDRDGEGDGGFRYEEKEQAAVSRPGTGSAAGASAAHSSHESTRRPSRSDTRGGRGSRSGSRSGSGGGGELCLPSGQLSRPPSRTPNPQWDSRHYIMAAAGLNFKPLLGGGGGGGGGGSASASPTSSKGAAGSMRGSASGKSLAVMHPCRTPSSAGAASLLSHSHSHSQHSASASASSGMYFAGRGSDDAALVRDGELVERALAAAAARRRADSAGAAATDPSSAAARSKSRSKALSPSSGPHPHRPTSAAVGCTRPLPAPSGPVSRTRPVSAAPFNGLHSHDERGSRSATTLAGFLRPDRERGGSISGGGGGPHSLSRSLSRSMSRSQRQHSVSAATLLSDPDVERQLAAILSEQNLDDHTLMQLGTREHSRASRAYDDEQDPTATASAAAEDEEDAYPAAEGPDGSERSSAHQSRRAKMHAKNRAARGHSMHMSQSVSQRAQQDLKHAAQIARAREEVVAVARGQAASACAGGRAGRGTKASGRSQRSDRPIPTISSTLEFLDDDEDLDEVAAAASVAATAAAAESAAFTVQHREDEDAYSEDAYSEDEAHSSPPRPGHSLGAAFTRTSSAAAAELPEHPESEMAPPARPWPSPPGLPPLLFQAALAKEEALAREDATVPLAPPPPEGEGLEDEEERWRGKLDWEEAMAEVPTPHVRVPEPEPEPEHAPLPAPLPQEEPAHVSDAAQPAPADFDAGADVAALPSSLSRAPSSSTTTKPSLRPSQSRSRLQQALSDAHADAHAGAHAGAHTDAETDPLPDEVCYSTQVSVRDLKMLMGVPPERGHGGTTTAKGNNGAAHSLQRSASSSHSLTHAPQVAVTRTPSQQQRQLDRQPSSGSLAHSRSQSRLSATAVSRPPSALAIAHMHIAPQQA